MRFAKCSFAATVLFVILCSGMLVLAADAPTSAPAASALSFLHSIPLPQITGGMNHMDADVKHQRLFVTAPSDKLLAIIDLKENRVLKTITGYGPAAARFLPDLNQLCVSGAKAVTFYDGDSFDVSGKVDVGSSVDELQYDTKTHRLYVGITDTTDPAVAIIDVPNRKLLKKIKLPSKPQGIVLNSSGTKLYANATANNELIVVDCQNQSVIAQWPLGEAKSNYPLAIDDLNDRLFVGCRNPAKLLVVDGHSGKSVSAIDIISDTDDLFFDPTSKRVYVSGGGGKVTVIGQKDANTYELLGQVDTAIGARTSCFSPQSLLLYVAVPHRDSLPAEVRVFQIP